MVDLSPGLEGRAAPAPIPPKEASGFVQIRSARAQRSSSILHKPDRVVDRRMNIAARDRVADPEQAIAAEHIVDEGLRPPFEHRGIVDLSKIDRARLKLKIETVDWDRAVFDDDHV